jgi:hypothetical protein
VPLSEVMVCGTPILAIQVEHRASAQAEAVMEDRWTGLPSVWCSHDGKKCVSLVKVVVDLLC